MKNSSYEPIILLLMVLVLVAAGLALIAVGRGCRADPPPPATIAPSPSSTSVLPTRQTPTSEPTLAHTKTATPTATSVPDLPTKTPTATILPTMTQQPTVALLGRHVVRRGETMYGIALAWEPRRFFLWGRDVWEPVCRLNPQIVDCRVLYPGDILRIPKR